MTIDQRLLGEWEGADGVRMVFQPDSSVYFGTVGIPYMLEDSGNVLNINNKSYYERLPGSSLTSIVGHWRDNPNGEEIIFRADGRYTAMFDDESVVYFGTYIATPTSLTSYEYSGTCATDGSQITFNYIFGNSQTGQYVVTDDSLLLQLGVVSIAYRRSGGSVLNRTDHQLRSRRAFGRLFHVE